MSLFQRVRRWAVVVGDRAEQNETTTDSGALRMVFGGFILVVLCGIAAPRAQAQEFEWVRSAGAADTNDTGRGIAVDASGNSYVTGRFRDTARFGPFTLTSAGFDDIFVAKYDGSGTVLWARRAGSAEVPPPDGSETGCEIAVDGAGNSYVIGNFLGTATFPPFELTSAGKDDVFLAKYNPSGTILWVRSAQGTGLDKGLGVALDGLGSIYVTGSFTDTVTFTPYTLTSPTGFRTIFVVKYDSAGNVVWGRTSTGMGTSTQTGAIAADASGNSYVVAEYSGTPTFGAFTLPDAEADVVVLKYDTAGNVLWARTGGGSLLDFPTGIAVDASRNSYITGWFAQGGFGVGTATFGAFTLTSAGESDVFVVKYDGAGNVLWAESGGGGSSDCGSGIAVDASGNTYLTGTFADVDMGGEDLTATFGPITLTSAGYSEVFLAKYDVDGNVVWAKSAGGSGNDGGSDIAVDPTGNDNYMTGYFRGTATFAPLAVTAAGVGADIFVAKLSDAPSATCSPDADADGIQDDVDVFPTTFSNSFQDTLTPPREDGGLTSRGDQTICVSNAPEPQGVKVESLEGGSNPARGQLLCGASVMNFSVGSGDSVTLTCHSAMAEATAGDIELGLLNNGILVATLVLPEGNSITYEAETLEVSAPAANPDTLILMTSTGGPLPLAPGQTAALPAPSTVPAASAWGVVALALVLLAGAKIFFGRRRAVQG